MKKKIIIPHLGYTIYLKNPVLPEYVAYVTKHSKNSCTLHIHRPVSLKNVSTLSHEVLHCIQYIAEARGIDMIHEMEHMGYLMSYIVNEVLGYEYDV